MDKRDILVIVDDMEVNRAILREVFQSEYRILEAENGEQALMFIEHYRSRIVAVLLDLIMPMKDGYQVMEQMEKKKFLPEIPVVVITSEDSYDCEVRVFDMGASDIIRKPFEPYVVKRRVENVVDLHRHRQHLEELVEEQAVSLRESNEVMIDALSSVIEYRSLESGQHILRIRMFTKILLEDVARSYQEYGLDERRIEIISRAASMHDVGKIAIPDSVLNKPGRLTPEEFEVMKTHSLKGCDILAGLDRMNDKEYLQYAYNICRYHHERWDGNGYPDGLRGDRIPICAQVVGLADAYDALTTERVYKEVYSQEKAYNMILNGECGAFSPKLLECFKNVRDSFAELARDYADGRSPKSDLLVRGGMKRNARETGAGTLEQGQMKYFSLLRYLESTVIELDISTGVYHVIYLSDNNFQLLRSGGLFEKALYNFTKEMVHPSDRKKVLYSFGEYLYEFFNGGMTKQSWKFRVYDQMIEEYRWNTATLLRTDVENPHHRKVIIIWHPEELLQEERRLPRHFGEGAEAMRDLFAGMQKCVYDKWCTIEYVNESFLKLLDYTRDEIRERFHDHFIEMICPADRDRVKRQMREQRNEGNTIEVEYRLESKNGQIIWVLDKCRVVTEQDGREHLYCLLIDITKTRMAQEELRMSLERHEIIMDQSNDIIFEWDIEGDSIVYSSNWEKKFGYAPIRESVSIRIPTVSHLHPADQPEFLNLMREIADGLPYKEAEVRIAKADGSYSWFRIRATAQFNGRGRTVKSVGVIIDINDEKKKTEELIDKAGRDSLTNLLNKAVSKKKIKDCLAKGGYRGKAAMLIIDLDNFKGMNDRFGHMFGDAVLKEFAGILDSLFRREDIVSRIGGDEFLVFMPRCASLVAVMEKAERILQMFKEIFLENLGEDCFSCSIGVSVCPDNGNDYDTLFLSADKALYMAKGQGKNRCLFYDPDAMGHGPEKLLAAKTRIDSEASLPYDLSGVIREIFGKLYAIHDFEEAVESILAFAGKYFQVSRAYIFEDSEDGSACSNTYEWCNTGIEAEKDSLQDIVYAQMGNSYKENFKEQNIFYCPDVTVLPDTQREILERQGIRSTLQCAIMDGGRFRGFVGFDDCVKKRLWIREQVEALTFVAQILSIFLLKERANEREKGAVDNLHRILDNQNAWIYVVDTDTYEFLYVNEKTCGTVSDAEAGKICYRSLMGRSEPCSDCPIRHTNLQKDCSREMYNPMLKLWVIMNTSMIRWGKKEACLVSCRDITCYKEPRKQENQA
ncbi:diguanylate cyclase [Lacrimispora sp. NSJ-141]|uniref:Stage 0 sporulation protein A homolog n=1 Tax=Lientehia hominis TaxID=2897778 RepID=A0AAP2RKJ1_9FIRM|nr:diguanylate cyclase [Lientehia hominis]MCD2493113.1 diguanylate cyclase [Lientehia hominis]